MDQKIPSAHSEKYETFLHVSRIELLFLGRSAGNLVAVPTEFLDLIIMYAEQNFKFIRG
jgi:hypothetical protein